ncbi:reverse transcriptase domain-containing protein [Tanacetum coccineum]
MEVIPDEEEVAIDVVPLATKSPTIVDWKIHKEGKKSYYQIVRADGKSQMYRVFSLMLKSFSREDLEDLYKLVKAKYKSTRPVEDLDLMLWSDLKTMFESHVEDEFWKLQQRYPLTPPTITDMLNNKLQGRIVGIKSLLNAVSITAALIDINAAQSKWTWDKDCSGSFKVNTLTIRLQDILLADDHLGIHHKWNSWVPRKINLCVWRASINKLSSRSNLSYRGITLPSVNYPFCDVDEENLDHCLLKCHQVISIWRKV